MVRTRHAIPGPPLTNLVRHVPPEQPPNRRQAILHHDPARPNPALLPNDRKQLVKRALEREQLLYVGVGGGERDDQEERLVADNLARVVERLDQAADPAGGGEDVALDDRGAVGEEDADQLEGEEAEVEVGRGEEREERVEWGRGGEEDVRVAKARVVANRLKAGRGGRVGTAKSRESERQESLR